MISIITDNFLDYLIRGRCIDRILSNPVHFLEEQANPNPYFHHKKKREVIYGSDEVERISDGTISFTSI